MTLVSVVTPTRPDREKLLVERCIPSVQGLDWPEVEHVIVSDPNPGLEERLCDVPCREGFSIRVAQINDTWRDGVRNLSIGAVPWHIGSLMALGEYVAFLGDDDELLPHHATRHITEALSGEYDFSVSPVQFRAHGKDVLIIGDQFVVGHLDATGIMCKRSALRTANWTATGENAADFRLVEDWMRAGLNGKLIYGPPTGVHNDGWLVGATSSA